MINKCIYIVAILLIFVSDALAHSGRTDACGGHRDRKHGGYHIHNYSKYCACYPDAPECKKGTNKKEEKKSTDTRTKK